MRKKPSYLRLLESGELERRARLLVNELERCELCPRRCKVDRTVEPRGVCRLGRHAVVSSAFAHFGEEGVLVGEGGSGTIFFSECNLRCVFCQNFDISHGGDGREVTAEGLASLMLALQEQGCHNINLVTPTSSVPQFVEALVIAARRGLRLPIVYNTSAYDSVRTLRLLEGIVDIYMPDFKFWEPASARRYCHAQDYPEVARQATREMHRHVGDLEVDDRGIAVRGLLVRHLVMPGGVVEGGKIMEFLAELSRHTYVNIMAQYRPLGLARKYPEIARLPDWEEVAAVYGLARKAGLYRFARP